MSKVEINKV